jgi:GH43 family beta-xylosidase
MNTFKDKRPFFGQDPHVVAFEDGSLLVQSAYNDRRIVIKSLTSLDDMRSGQSQTVWMDAGQKQVWAPELHNLDDKWYIYYASSDGENCNHRTYVIEADHPLGPYHQLGKVADPDNDFWSIDTTIFEHSEKRYAAWSGWSTEFAGFPQHLYLAELLSPNRIGTRSCLSSPHFNWEKSVAPLLEGPQVLKTQEKLFLTYSANASWTNEYCVGLLEYTGGPILDPNNWVKGPQPILKGGGHGCFIDSRYIYHRKLSTNQGWADREITSAPYYWENGYPKIQIN